MARPRFSEMLVNRRRQLGLSVKQASSVLRLKEEVLIAFEEGDFDAMPKSGYSQGMLSSYARYLGLNSRELNRQFMSDLRDWEHRRDAENHRRTRSVPDEPEYEVPSDERSRRARYRGSKGLLPTSGGYAGDLNSYSTVSRPRSRNSRPTQLVNYRQEAARQREASRGAKDRGHGSPYGQDRYGRTGDQRRNGQSSGDGGYTYGGPPRDYSERRYTDRDYADRSARRARGQSAGRYRAQVDEFGNAARYTGDEGMSESASRDRVTRMSVNPQYVDDLQYGNARPYQAASTRSGRQSSRNIASTDRPNVRRRQPARRGRGGASGGQAQRGGRAPRRRGGALSSIMSYILDSRHLGVIVLLLATVVITVVIIVSVNSCVNNQTGATTDRTVTVTTTSSDSGSSSSSDTSSSEDATAAAAALAAADDSSSSAATATVVSVSVESGEVSWVEIECDGESVVAEQITGPWSKSYTVTDSITIQVSDTTAVSVEKNGELQKFDSKTSGIGSITIEGTKVDDSSSSDTSTSTDGTTTSTDGTAASTTSTDTQTTTTTTTQ